MCLHLKNSGVAVLSCTDCSGSSTASSDITEPGSPFSTASEDSGSPPAKMPPAQTTPHHPQWPWTAAADEGSPPKRPMNDKTAFNTKRLKTAEEPPKKQSPPCLDSSSNKIIQIAKNVTVDSSPTNNNNYKLIKKVELVPKMQQGKITEYFKTQMKANGMRKELMVKSKGAANRVPLINQISSLKSQVVRREVRAIPPKKSDTKARKFSSTVPRKILPAPSKIPESIPANNQISGMHPFTPTMTLTAVSFPPNLTYLHTKAPKPPDNIFMPQVGAIPIINRNSCLNVIQPATLNNFNCVKLININALPSRLNGSNVLSVDTAMPTVLPVRPKMSDSSSNIHVASTLPKQYSTNTDTNKVVGSAQQCRTDMTRTEEPYRTEECQTHQSPSPVDSDSGISSRGSLEVCVDEPVVLVEQQKSPILSQPKTIRFPLVQRSKERKIEGRELGKSPPQSGDGRCRWDECAAQFDTSGALLEHLQVKHVISQSQANREQYVCLWKGCKVHGRTSCSISWLERHVLAHAGTKPFRCIVDGCGQRFNSQLMLERHVNNHFNTDGSQNASAKKSVDGPVKLFKRNGRIIRFRRQPWSARMFDFIDSGIMEGLQHKLLRMTQVRTFGKITTEGDTVNMHSQIVARRRDSSGSTELLVRWQPPDVIPDEWVLEKEYKPTRPMPILSLNQEARESLRPALFPCSEGRPGRRHRRKPQPTLTT